MNTSQESVFLSLTDGEYIFPQTISVYPSSVTNYLSADQHADTGLVPGVTAGPDCVVRDLRGAVFVLPLVEPRVVLCPEPYGVFPGRVLVLVLYVVTHTGPLLHVLQDHQVPCRGPTPAK